MRVITKEEELEPIVEEIFSILPQKKTAHVLALSGDLGVGKTSFTKVFARFLNISEHVTSPTFVIMKSYAVPNHDWVRELVHIDAYRVEDADEMRVLNLQELYAKEGTIVCIEWPERIKEYIPKDALHITITLNRDGTRTLSYEI